MNKKSFNLKNITESELIEILCYINSRSNKIINLEKLKNLMNEYLNKKRSRYIGMVKIIPVNNLGNQLQEIEIKICKDSELNHVVIAVSVRNYPSLKNYDFVEESPAFRNSLHKNSNTKYFRHEDKFELDQIYYVDVMKIENSNENSEDLIQLVGDLNIKSLEKEKNLSISKSLMEETIKKSFDEKSSSSLKEMIIERISSNFEGKEIVSYEEAEEILDQSKTDVIRQIQLHSSESE